MTEHTQNSSQQQAKGANMGAPEKPARDKEIEKIERKLLAAQALIVEGLSRLKELKAA